MTEREKKTAEGELKWKGVCLLGAERMLIDLRRWNTREKRMLDASNGVVSIDLSLPRVVRNNFVGLHFTIIILLR